MGSISGRKAGVVKFCRLILLIFGIVIFVAGNVWAERMSVKASKANVRSGPGTDKYEILWEVERYHPVEVLRKQGEWVFFRDFEGDQGWIYGKLLGKEASVITHTDLVNIRSGPGTQNNILFKAERGVPFRVLKRQGDWIHIRSAQGDKGWIHKKLVW